MDVKHSAKFRWPLVIAFVLVAIGIVIYRFSNTLSTTEARTAKPAAGPSNAPPPTDASELDSLYREQKQEQELSNVDVVEPAPRIEAISVSSTGESGIFIRGNFAREGDIVDGFRIVKIYPDKVEYEKDGKTITGVFPPPGTGKTDLR